MSEQTPRCEWRAQEYPGTTSTVPCGRHATLEAQQLDSHDRERDRKWLCPAHAVDLNPEGLSVAVVAWPGHEEAA